MVFQDNSLLVGKASLLREEVSHKVNFKVDNKVHHLAKVNKHYHQFKIHKVANKYKSLRQVLAKAKAKEQTNRKSKL